MQAGILQVQRNNLVSGWAGFIAAVVPFCSASGEHLLLCASCGTQDTHFSLSVPAPHSILGSHCRSMPQKGGFHHILVPPEDVDCCLLLSVKCLGSLASASILGRPYSLCLGYGAFYTASPTPCGSETLPCIYRGALHKTLQHPRSHTNYKVAAATGGEFPTLPQQRELLLPPYSHKQWIFVWVSCPSPGGLRFLLHIRKWLVMWTGYLFIYLSIYLS